MRVKIDGNFLAVRNWGYRYSTYLAGDEQLVDSVPLDKAYIHSLLRWI